MARRVDLSEFEMLHTLGRGCFGEVKFARCAPTQKHYAVKCLSKHGAIEAQQVGQVNSEKQILAQINHPFVVNMVGYAKDQHYLYIVMECISGGELFTHLSRLRKFTDTQAKFYAAQVSTALSHIHSKDIIHRDLKPENILLMANGYSKLTDFGLAKIVEPGAKAHTLCGTPQYMAPEVLLDKGHSKPVDWWALGVLIYEMLVGSPPFSHDEPMMIYQRILANKVYFPAYLNANAKVLVKKLLISDQGKRWGSLKGGPDDILQHKWFSTVDFDELARYDTPAPYMPLMRDDLDLSNFDDVHDSSDLPPGVPQSEDPFVDW